MIKAIIFDFFGVLATEGTQAFMDTYYPSDPGKKTQTLRIQDELNLATISIDDYTSALAKLGGVEQKEVDKYLDSHAPNTPLLAYIRSALKPKYKIGILSNAGDDWTAEILNSQDLELFDDIVLSYRVGLIKPNPDVYRLAAKNLNVDPSETVFVDDRSSYCQAARAVGMQAILYQSFGQFKTDLQKLITTSPNK